MSMNEDIINIVKETINSVKGPTILSVDFNYLYTFDVSDIDKLSKYCRLMNNKDWHNTLERWYNDQTVPLNIKPQQLVRKFDRIVNEGLEFLAGNIVGEEESGVFKFHALGDADDLTKALASDTQMGNEISRIDVTETTEGGSLSRNGSTIYITGIHPASIASTKITETGVFDSLTNTSDTMLDHSVFPVGVDHDQDENAPGATLIIYMCGI